MEALVDLLADMGLPRLSANMVIPSGSALDLAIQVTYSEIGEIVERVRRHARDRGIEFMWYSPTPMCLFNPLANGLGNKSCAACDGLLSVSPQGDVLPCSSYPMPVGNLLRQPFAEVWNSAQAVFFGAQGHAVAMRRVRGFHRVCGRVSAVLVGVGNGRTRRRDGPLARDGRSGRPDEERP